MKLETLLKDIGISITISLVYISPANSDAAPSARESGSLLNYAGAFLGGAVLSQGGGAQPALGVEAGTQAFTHIGIGGFFEVAPFSNEELAKNSTSYTALLVGSYFLDELIAGGRLGAKVGFFYANRSSDPPPPRITSALDFAISPFAGYDYSLGNGFSLGAETALLVISSNPVGSSLHLLFSVRYWF